MRNTLYAGPAENPRLDPRRPPNPRDDRDRGAWATFGRLLEAAGAGRASIARDLAFQLAEQGYGVEPVGGIGYRLVVPGRRAS